ncbi:MAG: 2-dehydro-3-deoxy-6-phosphogalactonate aldolase [Pseudomonadales bacterium]
MNTEPLPLVAILRGIQPHEVAGVTEALLDAGVGYIEVPLNSPEPFASIERLVSSCGDRAICGAGTVTTVEQVAQLADMGAQLIVSPHMNPALIAAAVARQLTVLPGVATMTEAMGAIDAGATMLKLFPAGEIGVGYLKSINEVLPPSARVFAVGGINEANLATFWQAGAAGFGMGTGIYRPGDSPQTVHDKASNYVALLKDLMEGS